MRVAVILFPASDRRKSRTLIEANSRPVVLFHFEKHAANAASGEMTEMVREQVARIAASALRGCDRDRENFRFVRSQPRNDEADRGAAEQQPLRHRVAFGEQGFELA